MPNTATTQTDPDGQALMRVFTDLGASPEDAYNATQGVRNMAGQNVTARLEAKIETFGAEIRTEIGHLSAKVDGLEGAVANLEGTVEGLEGTVEGLEGKIDGLAPASQVDALASQLQSLTSQMESQGVQLQSLTSQMESLVSPTSGLAAQVNALTVQVQGQAAQGDFANSMMTLLFLFLAALVGTGLITWFSDWRRARRIPEAGGSNNQSESQ